MSSACHIAGFLLQAVDKPLFRFGRAQLAKRFDIRLKIHDLTHNRGEQI